METVHTVIAVGARDTAAPACRTCLSHTYCNVTNGTAPTCAASKNCSDADLVDADLTKVNLLGVNLNGADLYGADLVDTNFLTTTQ
jgi:uncharacterized protein YjbI with pentapeptide repeats